MKKEKWALVSLTAEGVRTASRLAARLSDREVVVFTKEKYIQGDQAPILTDITSFFGNLMQEYRVICAIMATGIVVRAIAPYLQHKAEDPAILVMDTKGEFVISLLSGHLGGANEAARLVAERSGATAIITTATDVQGTMAVDVLAEKIGCVIDDFKAAKEITAKILHGEAIGIESDGPIEAQTLPPNIRPVSEKEPVEKFSGLIRITDKKRIPVPKIAAVQLVPKRLVIGIGCRRNVAGAKIIEKIELVLAQLNRHEKAVKTLATIELKKDEAGIDLACKHFLAKKIIIPDEMVKVVQSQFEGSAFVHQTTGLYAVSEPCGYIGSGFGKCLLAKEKLDGITISVWEEKRDA